MRGLVDLPATRFMLAMAVTLLALLLLDGQRSSVGHVGAAPSAFCHVTDGAFTPCPDGIQEWSDITPEFFKGSNSYLYADQADLDPDHGTPTSPLDTFVLMYDECGLTTPFGSDEYFLVHFMTVEPDEFGKEMIEHWVIHIFSDGTIMAFKNNELQEPGRTAVLDAMRGAAGFGASPNCEFDHVIVEFQVPLSEAAASGMTHGDWGYSLDPLHWTSDPPPPPPPPLPPPPPGKDLLPGIECTHQVTPSGTDGEFPDGTFDGISTVTLSVLCHLSNSGLDGQIFDWESALIPGSFPGFCSDDFDCDGVLDPEDGCASVPGPQDFAGCPFPPFPGVDSEWDGTSDDLDLCEALPGPVETGGCPLVIFDVECTAQGDVASWQTEKVVTAEGVIAKCGDFTGTNPWLVSECRDMHITVSFAPGLPMRPPPILVIHTTDFQQNNLGVFFSIESLAPPPGCEGTSPLPLANDRDGDSVPDDEDSCPAVPNPDQADGDLNGLGDACQIPQTKHTTAAFLQALADGSADVEPTPLAVAEEPEPKEQTERIVEFRVAAGLTESAGELTENLADSLVVLGTLTVNEGEQVEKDVARGLGVTEEAEPDVGGGGGDSMLVWLAVGAFLGAALLGSGIAIWRRWRA